MVVRFTFSALKEGRWSEHLTRFLLGGLATVVTGLVAQVWGPVTGGLFLALPASFCASATLVEKHERRRKEEKGMEGRERGKDAAALDAAGSGLGSIGLGVFAAVMWLLARDTAAGSLGLAAIAWLAVVGLMWVARRQARMFRT